MCRQLDFSEVSSRLKRVKPQWTPTEKAVLRTLVYASLFRGRLTVGELSRYVISDQVFSQSELHSALVSLQKNAVSAAYVESVLRGGARHFSKEKWRAITSLVTTLSWIPWIDSIWITGSVAVGSARETDDIDVLFITSPQRLWLVRALVISIGILLGKYRFSFYHRASQLQDQWCCNIWLESPAQRLGAGRQNVYTAREIIQAVPVYRRWGQDVSAFYTENIWVQKWCLTGWIAGKYAAKRTYSRPILRWDRWVPEQLWSALNHLLYQIQMVSIRRKQSREEVSFDRAFFHPSDTQQQTLDRYEKICQELGVE